MAEHGARRSFDLISGLLRDAVHMVAKRFSKVLQALFQRQWSQDPEPSIFADPQLPQESVSTIQRRSKPIHA